MPKSTAKTADPEAMPTAAIELRRLALDTAKIAITGTAPLIVHRFDEKSKQMMLDAQQRKARQKEPKDPEAQYQASLYRLEDGTFGFPAVGFKAAIVGAARHFDGITLVQTKQAIRVLGEGSDQLVRIEGSPRMREDTVRLGGKTADLRYRGEFWPWSTELTIRFLPSVLTGESLVALVDAAGMGGIGEWRPSAPALSGTFGTWEVVA